MERKQFEPTEKQIEKWSALVAPTMPTDDEFKAQWKKAHHGKETGWGMGKRNWVAGHVNDSLVYTVEYNLGLWQGRVDAVRDTEPMETNEYHTNPFHFGYYTGFHGFASFWKGYGQEARDQFNQIYLSD